ncbi:hypothetical protein [Pyxidicoccus xibeiensis]|uniref:hypothetical protein n=1 Tax=Pyxidicoccus xibeiensis TaxID=2906759 RepID=UPI0020A7BF0E|nr:hypothetical protein [Pyxidicoccus xibeiensis]MCP3140385.1 hypothetical protein [Pyxidicoccus xibeiensis]
MPRLKLPTFGVGLVGLMATASALACGVLGGKGARDVQLHVEVASPSLEVGADAQVWTCALTITGSSGTTVDVSYVGPPGNQPHTFQNFVALWRASVVPWGVVPEARLTVPTDGETGSLVLMDVSITRAEYTTAYAVGPEVDDICASALLEADGSAGPVDAVTAKIVSLGADSLTVRYHTLDGYLPATAGNWLGLWRGRVSPYHAPAEALARVPIPQDVTDGDVDINGVKLEPDFPHTLIYFMDKDLKSAAVVLQFTPVAR